jgi:hypothetical protein
VSNRKIKKRRVGEVVHTQFVRVVTDEHGNSVFYWFEVSEGNTTGLSPTNKYVNELYKSGKLHGPFATQDEAEVDSTLVLLGKDCVVKDGARVSPSSGGIH